MFSLALEESFEKPLVKNFDFCIFDLKLWMNGFVNTFLSGERWYLLSEIQPQYLHGKQFQIAVYSTSN